MNTCRCGCGEPVAPGRTYRQGHVARTAAFKAAVHEPRRTKVDPPNPSGLCLCGCGQPTTIATWTSPSRGILKGHPTKYVHGHTSVGKGAAHHLWKGGRIMNRGYVLVHRPDHPAANRFGKVPEHRLVWEEANGRLLGPNEHIHHINGVRDDNRPENLTALSPADHRRVHGSSDVARFHAEHPGWASEIGKRGALARWGDAMPRVDRSCPLCGASFTVPENSPRKYCSRKCVYAARSGGTGAFVCHQCGKDFHDSPSSRRTFCSRKCYGEARFAPVK